MQSYEAVTSDPTELVYRHHEQLYRLALLLAGDKAAAAKLVEQTYRQFTAEISKTSIRQSAGENQLLGALLRQSTRRPRRRPQVDRERLGYASLDRERALSLLDTLAAMPPSARLVIGLHYLRGLSADEIERTLPQRAPTSATRRAARGLSENASADEILTHFRVATARALGVVPPEIDETQLAAIDVWLDARLPDEAATALRRAAFEQPAVRAAREGMAAARDLLSRAIPALFAGAPPPDLTARLLKQSEQRRPPEAQSGRGWARAGLAVGVLMLAVAIIFVPTWLDRGATPAASRPPAVTELIDGAIHRFERAPLAEGVLHERYRVADSAVGVYLVERWYDYATPHRLRIAVRAEGGDGVAGPTLLEIGSDGRSLVQFRYGERRRPSGARPLDARVTEAEAQASLAVLRAEPTATPFAGGRGERVDTAPLYLAQAREQGAVFLGQTRMLDRPAYLLAYRTDRLPAAAARQQPAAAMPVQVVLTIDAQTYALLDVSVVAEGQAESNALHPFQAQVFEVQPSVPETLWQLPTDRRAEQRVGLPSARAPEIPNEQVIGLDDALRRTQRPILAPQPPPNDAMRGLALSIDAGGDQHVALLYEGEFQSVLLAPLGDRAFAQAAGEERSAGAFRYRIIESGQQSGRASAVAFQPEAPDESVFVLLIDGYATPAEREDALGRIIGSLAPVTEQNLPDMRRIFYGPPTAGGQN
jgi:hypothetical protein